MNKPVTGADLVIPKVTTGSLPASRKVYSRPEAAPELRVPIREIALDASSGEPPLPVYDTTGPYTDPNVTIDVEKGLARNRIAWVKERGGVEEYQGRDIKPEDNGNVGASHAAKAFTAHHKPLRGLDGHMITQLEFARAGIITKEMIYVAVSATTLCAYCIASHTAAARKAGMTDAMFAELMAVVGMANETNRLASGYQVEIDEAFKT